MLAILLVSGCEEFLSQIDAVTITVEEQIVDADVAGDPMHIPLVETAHLSAQGGIGKLAETGWIEIEMTVSDYVLLMSVLDEEGGAFSGTVTNNAANAVTFGIYLSETSGLSDPLTQAAEIVSTVIPAGATLDLEDLSGFSTALQNFFAAHPGIGTVYVYLAGDADPDLDVTVNDVAFTMPPAVRVTEQIHYEDYAEYEDVFEEVLSGEVSGSIVNNGTGDVSVLIYVSVMGAGFVPTDVPPDTDVIVDIIVAPGETVNLSGVVDEAVLISRIETLFSEHVDLLVTAVLTSNAEIQASLQDISIAASVAVTT
jgi:hypothetical protein